MPVMIVESPNKIKKIEEILGRGWVVAASYGHIRDLPRNELGVDLTDFGLDYEFIPDTKMPDGRVYPGGKSRVARIKGLLKKGEQVYLATDPDREGEAISWHLKESLGLSEDDYVRVTFNEITESVIKKSITEARKIDYEYVKAQEARRALDRLVGYLVSPVISNLLGENLSAGRVQSVATRLVTDLEDRITNFKKTDHFGARVNFGTWQAEWDTSKFITKDNPYVLDESLANKASSCRNFTVAESSNDLAKESPPSAFSTSLLLQAASIKLKFDPDLTNKLAQKLYEQGQITYLRTDSVNISDEFISEIRTYANTNDLPLPEKPRRHKSKADAQGAHEGIRPTHLDVLSAGEDENQRKLYELIWQRTVASQLDDAVYSVNELILTSTDSDQNFNFKAKGRTLISAGWRKLTQNDDAQETQQSEDTEESGAVPLLDAGSNQVAIDGKLLKKQTRPPTRYTQASLIKKLEHEGIGRPATFAPTVAHIMNKGYIAEEKRYLKPTATGQTLIKSLVTAGFCFMDFDFTRDMESLLDGIEDGTSEYVDVVAPLYHQLTEEIASLQTNGTMKPRHPCPKCESALRRYQKSGKVPFWFCTNQECRHTMDDVNGEPTEKQIHPCPKCKTTLVRYKKKTGGGFGWFCPAEDCKTFLEDAKGKPVAQQNHACPACGKPLVRRKGQYGVFWACSGYQDGCKMSMDDKNGKPVPKQAKKTFSVKLP